MQWISMHFNENQREWKLLGATHASPNPPTACRSELPVGDTYLDEKIWLSADSNITASARSALATRPNGGREARQIQPGMHWEMQNVQNPLNIQ